MSIQQIISCVNEAIHINFSNGRISHSLQEGTTNVTFVIAIISFRVQISGVKQNISHISSNKILPFSITVYIYMWIIIFKWETDLIARGNLLEFFLLSVELLSFTSLNTQFDQASLSDRGRSNRRESRVCRNVPTTATPFNWSSTEKM